MTAEVSDAPYAGVRVLDLAQGVAGPYCAEILAQQGATVTKVEPLAGDWVRGIVGSRDGIGPLAIFSNLGKRSLCLDFAKPQGRDVVLKLAERADVCIEGYRPGVMDKLGLGYPALSARNPGLIYVSISAFGSGGPLVAKAGTDSVMQAMTGMASLNRDKDGTPRRLPLLVPDTGTAIYAAQAVGAALYARMRGGRGRHLEISLLQCCLAFQAGQILESLLMRDLNVATSRTVPYGVFATADGHIVLLALHEAMWRNLCKALDRSDWLNEPRYATMATRGQHSAEIDAAIARILKTRTTAQWDETFDRHDVLCAPTMVYTDLPTHPQVRAQQCFVDVAQPPWGELPLPRQPFATEPAPGYCPRAGEHSRAILAESGYSENDIARLERDGIVKQFPLA